MVTIGADSGELPWIVLDRRCASRAVLGRVQPALAPDGWGSGIATGRRARSASADASPQLRSPSSRAIASPPTGTTSRGREEPQLPVAPERAELAAPRGVGMRSPLPLVAPPG